MEQEVRVGAARAAAADWIARHAAGDPAYRGSYYSGSTVGMPDDAMLAPTSDVDVVVVTDGRELPAGPGKFRHRGALLEVSRLPWADVRSPTGVLADYHLAGSFRYPSALDDPTGELAALHAEVARRFAEREWVRRRCADARRRIVARLDAPTGPEPFHEQVTRWLFGTGVTTHVLLVAALRNPTVRLRYVRAREVLQVYGHTGLHRELLDLLGCADLSAGTVRRHLDTLADTFDATARVARTPFFFSGDLTTEARPVAVDGSRDLVEDGSHREAVFWIVATLARCHTALAADAPSLHRTLLPDFHAVLADLGVTSVADLRTKAARTLDFLPRLDLVAEDIMDRHPGITG
ncbi:hypothetical protein QNO07_14345 [Streptomyces sp. 549]|uniref:hypothetical protein n=1 Tax=Streptomyces sp. 549 TaxID=3049076 RepID=UPI0024C36B11|nr:hypothetical protein [Streptomyces sp. 549]MDK1474586.1 hypothetical protein [Streptomyces sp. 549]